jgi:hypothetical protein
MYYVTMTDQFMSGWGGAEGRKSKLVFECADRMEAEIVAENARLRSEMKYINITTTKPHYSVKTAHTSWNTKEDAPNWYVYRYFAR